MARRKSFKSSVQRYSGVKLNSKNGYLMFFVILPVLAYGLLINYWRQIAIVAGLAFSLYLYNRYSLRKAIRKSGIHDIDKMPDGRDFEKRLKSLFNDLGFRARLTPHNDYGCDVVVEKYKGMKTVVQAKLSGGKAIGLGAVQEAVTSMAMYGAIHALVITNREYTSQARVLAKKNGVELWNRDILILKLAQASKENTVIQSIFHKNQSINILPRQMKIPAVEMESSEEISPSVDDDEPYIPF
ncbi:MAG TPA: restriction endonuclease [Desulfosporosinus sp.]|nr:restriction endonuclease [Desulfosporosinus sp.]